MSTTVRTGACSYSPAFVLTIAQVQPHTWVQSTGTTPTHSRSLRLIGPSRLSATPCTGTTPTRSRFPREVGRDGHMAQRSRGQREVGRGPGVALRTANATYGGRAWRGPRMEWRGRAWREPRGQCDRRWALRVGIACTECCVRRTWRDPRGQRGVGRGGCRVAHGEGYTRRPRMERVARAAWALKRAVEGGCRRWASRRAQRVLRTEVE
jgi:hypothetical protein